MIVRDIMCDRVVTVGAGEQVISAARLMKRFNLGAIPVTDGDGRLRGMITDRDITLRCTAAGIDPKAVTVRDIMSRSIVTIRPGDEVGKAARAMGTAQVRRLPVVDGQRLIGMLTLADMARSCDMEAASALADISSNLRRRTIEVESGTDGKRQSPSPSERKK